MLKVIYRLSDNGYPKEKFSFATKEYCLRNFCKHFNPEQIYLLVDDTNLKDETYNWIKDMHDKEEFAKFFIFTGGSSAQSWKFAFELATDHWTKSGSNFHVNWSDDQQVYFVEDDYLHRDNSQKILLEGLERADYCTLYLHGDRFIPAENGGNPHVDSTGAFVTRVFKTNSSFWCQVESTTQTFATTVGQLREDEKIWRKWTMVGTHPHDFQAFLELSKKGKTLISPIPGLSTHCEPMWQSPLIEWNNV